MLFGVVMGRDENIGSFLMRVRKRIIRDIRTMHDICETKKRITTDPCARCSLSLSLSRARVCVAPVHSLLPYDVTLMSTCCVCTNAMTHSHIYTIHAGGAEFCDKYDNGTYRSSYGLCLLLVGYGCPLQSLLLWRYVMVTRC